MSKKFIFLCMAIAWATTIMAQNIAVVSPSGETSLYETFPAAVEGAEEGSTVYLPGGTFSIPSGSSNNYGYLAISKKLTIIGAGHKITPCGDKCLKIC